MKAFALAVGRWSSAGAEAERLRGQADGFLDIFDAEERGDGAE